MKKTTLSKLKKQVVRFCKRHKNTIWLIGFILNILSLILPFIIEERIVLIQKVRVKELPIIYEYSATPEETAKITDFVYIIIERANGTIEYIKGK